MSRYLNVLSQASDNKGKSIDGATLSFFEAGPTSTKLTTYQDENLTPGLENTNPVVADNGRFPDIWLQARPYYIEFRDADGELLDAQDNVQGGNVDSVTFKDTKDDLSAVFPSAVTEGQAFYMSGGTTIGDGAQGHFTATLTDISIQVANDTQGGIYIPFDEAPGDGTNGGFIRNFSGAVDVQWFLPTSSDATPAFLSFAAYLNANGGGPCASTGPFLYVLKEKITFTSPVYFIVGNGALFDATDAGFTGDSVFAFEGGDPVQIENLGANATKGDRILTFASPPSLVVGQEFAIANPTDFSYSLFRDIYRAGEWCTAAAISGNDVILEERLEGSYVFGDVNVYSVDLLAPYITGLNNINASISTSVLIFTHCTGNLGDNININHENNSLINISRCYNAQIGMKGRNVGDGGDDYGLSINNSHNVTAHIEGDLYGRRHSVQIGGGDHILSVPNTNIKIIGGTHSNLQTLDVHCADMHGNVRKSAYINSVIYGGATFQGESNDYIDCEITARNDGVLIDFSEIKGGHFGVHNIKGFVYDDPWDNDQRGIVDIGGNDNNSVTADTVLDFTYSMTGDVFCENTSINTKVVQFDNRGTDVKINFDIQHLKVYGTIDEFLNTNLVSGTADSDFCIVDNVWAESAAVSPVTLATHAGASYRAFPQRMMQQMGAEELTTIASGTVTGTAVVLDYPYPRVPIIIPSRTNAGYMGGRIGIAIATGNAVTGFTPSIRTDDAVAFNAGDTVTYGWRTGLAEC